MRALAISDLHFGAWTADPLLRDDFALPALDTQLQDADELVLLVGVRNPPARPARDLI
jgi:hypothetical protein